MRWYALSNRPWVEEVKGRGHWGLPPGTIGSVDLAPVGSQSHVFVTSDAPFDPADVAATFGDGTRLDGYVPTAAEATAWETLVGVAWQAGWTLLDALWATLTAEADPDGVTRARPIMPTRRGVLELHLGGHSLVRAENLPADPTTHPAWPNIQRVLQNSYRAIQGRDRTLARKWLGNEQSRYRLSPERARDLIIPADLPPELPLKPTTTISDDFNRANESLNASADWAEVIGNLDIVSNEVSATNGGSFNEARHATALSSADHYSQITINSQTSAYPGALCRFASTSRTYYAAKYQSHNPNRLYLERMINGGDVILAFGATGAFSPGEVYRIEADGSSITAKRGAETITVTDTTITGNLQAGFGGWAQAVYDGFEAADLLAETGLVRVRSEALGTGEARLRARGRTSAYDESLAIDHVVQRLRGVARRRGEGVALADMSTAARALSRLRNETVGLIETTAFVVEALAEALVRVLAETVAMAEAVARPRRLTRIRAELAGITDAVARVGGFVSAVVPVITSRLRMRVEPSTRMNVPPARR